MLESEVIYGFFFGRQHDLESLFPREAGVALAGSKAWAPRARAAPDLVFNRTNACSALQNLQNHTLINIGHLLVCLGQIPHIASG
jgi:hypothetical protein